MIAPVVIRMADLIGREGQGRGTSRLSRPCASGMTHLKLQFIEHRERGTFTVSAICNQGGFPIRAAGNLGTLYLELQSSQTVLRPAIPFISARLPRVDTGALSGVSLPPLGLGFKFCRPFRLPGSLIRTFLSIAIYLCQKSFRGIAQAFQEQFLSAQETGLAVGVYGQHTDRSEMKCPTKALKDSTK